MFYSYFHDVGLVDCSDLLAIKASCIIESKFCDSLRLFGRNNFKAFNYTLVEKRYLACKVKTN